jgi:hypothetical protein
MIDAEIRSNSEKLISAGYLPVRRPDWRLANGSMATTSTA